MKYAVKSKWRHFWQADEESGEEIRLLVDQGRLTLKPQDPAVWYHTMPPVF